MVLDLYARKVVGWAIDRRCEAVLVNDALSKAAGTRVTSPATVMDSDHGVQFTSWAFSETSVVSGSMQIELLNRQRWSSVAEVSVAMAEWIEDFYNSIRRHSSLGYLSPNGFEALESIETQAAFS